MRPTMAWIDAWRALKDEIGAQACSRAKDAGLAGSVQTPEV